ncbi:MAG: amidase [Rhodospirillaceae bacterium]|jgi:amidase|nr:amidase [Rhodospirillaceae bacterium]MBT6202227.1 amidase [Rhodospirillaceae bacterium]MBT6509571.1 amidase [Rhodospirillaceae bacterium]MBT7615311.1 amidase [Rhodospirillaceae bacterium]MBT7647540.1 amidase [Rhodospirillaceae bacterium]
MDATDLCYLSAVEQKALLDRSEVSVVELVDAQIDRIEKHNPHLNAFVTPRYEEARKDAAAADAARANGTARGVLHGLTVGVKDCFATKGLRTTFATKAFENHVPDYDHLVVQREKAQGAIILGKLNTPEYTMASNLCDNPVFGKTRSPYGRDRAPGASSGGSAAALAAGLCSLADGSDIGGSVRNPAAWNNIVGHRPTSWMIPDVPNPLMWHNMNTAGPMARTVADAALFLSALAGPDPRCPVVVSAPFAPGLPDLSIDMKGLRIGWACDHGSLAIEPDVASNFEAQKAVFEDLGAIVEVCNIDLGDIGGAYSTLAYQRVSREVEPAVGRGLDAGLEAQYHATRASTGADLMDAETRRHRLWNDVALAFANHDVLVWPDDPCDPFAYNDEETSQALDWTLLLVSPMLGLPTTTLPCGFSISGSPRGLQVLGRPGMDLLTLQVSHAYEQATQFGQKRPDLD